MLFQNSQFLAHTSNSLLKLQFKYHIYSSKVPPSPLWKLALACFWRLNILYLDVSNATGLNVPCITVCLSYVISPIILLVPCGQRLYLSLLCMLLTPLKVATQSVFFRGRINKILALCPSALILLVEQSIQLLTGGVQGPCSMLQELTKGPTEPLTQKDHCGYPSGPTSSLTMVSAQECLL